MKENLLRIEECIACSDLHVPMQSNKAISEMIAYAELNKIRTLIIIGDLWTHESISDFAAKDKTITLKKELEAGVAVLRRLAGHFTTIHLLAGNHCLRMMKSLNYNISYSEWMDTIIQNPRIKCYDETNIKFISGGRKFIGVHPQAYSKIKNKLAADLAHHYNCHLIVAHQHHLSISTSLNGNNLCIDSGALVDPKKVLYKQRNIGRWPEWDVGFVHIKSGKARIIGKYTF